MRRISVYILCLLYSFGLTKSFGQNANVQGTWYGTATMFEKLSGEFFTSERYIELTITKNKVTGTVKYSGDVKLGTLVGHDECFGIGAGELKAVNIRTWDSTYDINIEGPECKLVAGGGNSGDGVTGIGISNQRLQLTGNQLNTTVLSGTETFNSDEITVTEKFTRTTTWHLVSSLDAELIVKPKDYDTWMPKATNDELRKGDTMHIDLKVQDHTGGVSSLKVARFELKLSNTSREKGTTLNMPLNPSANQLPDLRFIRHPIAESINEDQYIEIPSADGKTGTAIIASYDGGGWTTLTAVAVLEGGIRIEGTLLTPGGIKEIPIPKRNGTAKIATAWLAQYGNLEDTADHELPAGHGHKGDGLSAYEEYRGVITEGSYKKLNPVVQELGIRGKKADLDLFDYGITMFKNATMIEPVKFDDLEINTDRRLNNNAAYANVYKQFALWIHPGHIREFDLNGKTIVAAGIAVNGPGIPEKISEIIIDTGVINSAFRDLSSTYQQIGVRMPYSEKDNFGRAVAHEISHGVNVYHHGTTDPSTPKKDSVTVDGVPPVHAWDITNTEWKPISYIFGAIGTPQSLQSGDLGCFMCYTPYYNWVLFNGIMLRKYYQVSDNLTVGTKMCSSAKGTSINANGKFFGDAKAGRGNCLSHIQFK
jgi:hypothetical protein